jgi:flagellar biosynthetic protein FliP
MARAMGKGFQRSHTRLGAIAIALLILLPPLTVHAQQLPATQPIQTAAAAPVVNLASNLQLPDLSNRQTVSSTLQLVILLTVLSLAPAILLMMTSFTRIIIVLSLLRQGLGAPQLPPNQVLVGLAMFMTFLVMAPTWQRVNSEAVQPYLSGALDQKAAVEKATVPVRQFMSGQIRAAGNDADVDVFTDAAKLPRARSWDDVPTTALMPAFMLSELKVAFGLGVKIYLPFLIIDLVVSTLLVSMGMMMLPPTLVSLPFKLLLFAMVDGWHLITAMLLGSFAS